MALKHLLPGVTLQPSGVFAVLRAQEAGCQYLLASEA
jgi:intracellular sulfur oxidation DsrE/DsrF family protein